MKLLGHPQYFRAWLVRPMLSARNFRPASGDVRIVARNFFLSPWRVRIVTRNSLAAGSDPGGPGRNSLAAPGDLRYLARNFILSLWGGRSRLEFSGGVLQSADLGAEFHSGTLHAGRSRRESLGMAPDSPGWRAEIFSHDPDSPACRQKSPADEPERQGDPGEVSSADPGEAIDGTSANSNVEELRVKVNELIAALRRRLEARFDEISNIEQGTPNHEGSERTHRSENFGVLHSLFDIGYSLPRFLRGGGLFLEAGDRGALFAAVGNGGSAGGSGGSAGTNGGVVFAVFRPGRGGDWGENGS